MTLRRWILVLLVGVTLYAVQGCAANGEGWYAKPDHAPLPAVVMVVEDVAQVCGRYPGMWTHGCAARVYDANVCVIYVPTHPMPGVVSHEMWHCAGYSHDHPMRVGRL